MIREAVGDIVKDKKYDIFCHQTNCKGVMGAGLALQIGTAYPEVAEADRRYCLNGMHGSSNPVLGSNLYVKTSDGRTCVNMYAQNDYGRDSRKTSYSAFQECLERLIVKLKASDPSLKIAFPKRIGCGLAGGEWNIILPMLRELAKEVPQDVYIVEKAEIY